MYKKINDSSVVLLETGTVIPLPPCESYGFNYQSWLDEGNTPEPAEEPTQDQEVIRQQKLLQISNEMLQKGALEPLTYMASQFALSQTRIKYPTQTNGLSDDQVIAAMTNPASPYFNAGFADMYSAYLRLKEVS